jgi:MinD-like ATPase involved in chromosome partitioning or flagellar assembly
MAKIGKICSGPIPPDPDDPRAIDGHKEVVVTPNPKNKAQRQANKKAQRLIAATKRQEANAHAPAKLSKWQEKSRRKRKRELYYKPEQVRTG